MPDAFDFDFSRVDPARAREILSGFGGKPTRLMEVCGTHTHQIARFGIKSLLPNGAQLQSGPRSSFAKNGTSRSPFTATCCASPRISPPTRF